MPLRRDEVGVDALIAAFTLAMDRLGPLEPCPGLAVAVSGGADQVFRISLRSSGIVVLTIMGTIGLFLFFQGAKALSVAGFKFITTQAWEPDTHNFGIATVIPFRANCRATAEPMLPEPMIE